MKRIVIALGLGALTACAASEQSSGPPLGGADVNAGLSSGGTLYPVSAPSGKTADAVSGAQGTGETTTTAYSESSADFDRLRALPPINPPGISIFAIIGSDDRQKVANTTTYPERAQVLIALPRGRCSGVLVGKDLVLTAGHCVHGGGSSGSWQASATVYPGRNGPAAPYGSCAATRFYSVVGWVRDANPAYDFGAIKLNCDIGERTGFLGFFWQAASLVGVPARITSYPGDKPLEQWGHADQVRSDTAQQTRYQTDTMPGNSGSGVFAATGVPSGCGGPCTHTAHAYGGSTTNSGTRITQGLFDNLVRWKAEPK